MWLYTYSRNNSFFHLPLFQCVQEESLHEVLAVKLVMAKEGGRTSWPLPAIKKNCLLISLNLIILGFRIVFRATGKCVKAKLCLGGKPRNRVSFPVVFHIK